MCVTFFFDENLGSQIVEGLRNFGFSNVIHISEVFPIGTSDVDWLEYVGEKGYVLVTKDKNIRRNPKEKDALKKYNIVAFYLGGNQKGTQEIAKQLINSWDKMESIAKSHLKKRGWMCIHC